jgi:hypothetical protein
MSKNSKAAGAYSRSYSSLLERQEVKREKEEGARELIPPDPAPSDLLPPLKVSITSQNNATSWGPII